MNLTSFQKSFKNIALVLVLAVSLGVAVFAGRGASTYFGARASSCPVKNVTAVNVTSNSAIISWDSSDKTQGKVEYGTSSINLAFNAPETSADTVHKIPLTLLTPNTVYYYLITVGSTKCDSTNQKCEASTCVPYSFTTAPVAGIDQTAPAASNTTNEQQNTSPTPKSLLSAYCQKVSDYIGKTKADVIWKDVSQYDIDKNGIINGLDIIKCQKSGK